MSQSQYSKREEGRNRNTTPLSSREDCDFTLVSIIIPSILEEVFLVHVAHGNVVELSEDIADVAREVGVWGLR